MSSNHDNLAPLLVEAKELLDNAEITKSNSARATMRTVVRVLETLIHGKPLTPIPPKHHDARDGLGVPDPGPQPSAPRRL